MPDFVRRSAAVLLVFASLAPGNAFAQCMLANPSFEISGTAPNVFGGWSQFGSVGSASPARHGAFAARVSGPNTGNWDVSGYWQPQASAAGDRWKVTGYVRVPAAKPLAGGSKAIVNVEWRNSGGALISYESHDVATAATARDTFLAFSFLTAAAPANTASARLVLGVLQGPTDPQRDAWFDHVTFEKQATPSLDALQWGDFSNGRTVSFAGRTWRVKNTGVYGPGPNSFSSAVDAVWVDANGRLHLTIKKSGATWYSTEVALDTPLGYGDYLFTTRGDLDTFQPTTVFGLFVWEYGPCWDTGYLWWNPFNEIDVEFSRWGIAGGPNAQFVAQPYDWGGNRNQFTMNFSTDEVTTHAFRWRPDRVEYRTWRGGPNDESPASTVRAWTYTGPHIPRPDQPRVHLNLWQFSGAPTVTQEAVLDGFTFRAWPTAFLAADEQAPGARSLALSIAGRNPTRGGAVLRCALPAAERVRVSVHDVAGRLVRELVNEPLAAGTREFAWDGRDTGGERAAPGVYLARLQAGARVATARLVVLR
ncbi:MAG: FlgD immunoglobulin-like domain containing protein [Candidatus Eisenbacteria bacterium]